MLKWTGNENYSQALTQTKVKWTGNENYLHVQALTQIKVIMDSQSKYTTVFVLLDISESK
jgi:hypothetical protein